MFQFTTNLTIRNLVNKVRFRRDSLIARKRYNTITTAANSFRSAYGNQTADALAYGVHTYGYTLKDRVGFPNIKVPSVAKYNGKLNRCVIVRSMRNLRNG
jgi:hypothetical protein